MTFFKTLATINADLAYRAYLDHKPFPWYYYVKVFLNPAALGVVIYRFQHWFHVINLEPAARLLAFINVVLFGVDIDSAAEIGPGLVLAHANSIFVDGRARIGKYCCIVHQNTISVGDRAPKGARVVLGDSIMVGAGARIIGNLTLGDHCQIGMNAVVTRSMPSGSVVAGIPARILRIDTNPPARD